VEGRLHVTAGEYKNLIESLLDGTISMNAFESTFLKAFKALPVAEQQLYVVLRPLWSVVETYADDCLPGQETLEQSSELLVRQVAKQLLKPLELHIQAINCLRSA
jgi:hypothetical protein